MQTNIIIWEDLPPVPAPGYEYILRASFWHWGLKRRLYAHSYGLKAFRLKVKSGGPRRLPPDRAAATPGNAPRRPRAKTPRP